MRARKLPAALTPGSLWPIVATFVATAVLINGLRRMVGYAVRYGTTTPDGTTYLAALDRFGAGAPVYTAMQHAPYRLTDASWGVGYVYPPSALAASLPLEWLGTEPWRVLNFAFLAFACLAIVNRERSGLSIVSVLTTLAYLAINPFMWSAWTNAQVTPFLVGLMAFGYVFPRYAAVLGSLGALIKVYPAVMWLWALRYSGWRAVRDGALVLGVALLVSWPFIGHLWGDFVGAMRFGVPSCDVGLPDSVRCLVGEPAGQLVAVGIGGGVALMGVLLTSRQLAFACICFGTMLASPDLNSAYWLLPSVGVLPALAKLFPAIPTSGRWAFLVRATAPPWTTRRIEPGPVPTATS